MDGRKNGTYGIVVDFLADVKCELPIGAPFRPFLTDDLAVTLLMIRCHNRQEEGHQSNKQTHGDDGT